MRKLVLASKRLENGSLEYNVTVEDREVWSTPGVMPARTFVLRPEAEHVYSRYFEKAK